MFNWEALSAIAEAIGALAVVVSLIYLAVQIRQSGRIGRLAAHQSLSDSITAAIEPLYADPALSRIWASAPSPDELTPEEQERFGLALWVIFGKFYNAYLLGEIDPVLSKRYLNLMDRFLRRNAVQSWWRRQGGRFVPEFAALVDERLKRILEKSG